MVDGSDGPISLRDKMKHVAYTSMYNNIRRRLCREEEMVGVDFFTTKHVADAAFVAKYRDSPMAIRCIGIAPFSGEALGEVVYLVVSGKEKTVLLLSPQDAANRNLPYLAVLENGFFRPYLGCATTYWQNHIEPEVNRPLNVLHSPETSVINA